MRSFFQIISYLLHPIFIPLAGTILYFQVTPKFTSNEFESGTVLPILILTVIIPVIAFLILKNLGLVNTVMLPTIKERRYPMYIGVLMLLLVIYKVLPNNFTVELHYFFLGLISATAASIALLYLNFKSSMHLMGMGSLLMYIICLSVHFEINITLALSILILLTGLAASSRIFLKAHSKVELLIGFLIGVISQLLTVKFWL